MPKIIKSIRKSFHKNKAEALALLSGKMPSFVYGVKKFKDIPVFCFHSARYPEFENQLKLLNKNGYKTLTADELYERHQDKNYKNNGKEIVLTFDDGMSSVWTVAYPLLEKYEHKIVSFILPGLMEEGNEVGATIDDVSSEEDEKELANRDYSNNPLCNWKEVEAMHQSGLVDFQSHGMYHALISTSPTIVDFIHPEFDAYHYGNVHIPVYFDAKAQSTREKVLGHPVYQHAPRLSGLPQYIDSLGLRLACAEYVKNKGEVNYFKNKNWRKELFGLVKEYAQSPEKAKFVSPSSTKKEILTELKNSKIEIEDRLGKEVKHFCFPWFVGSHISSELLIDCGYLSSHLGATHGFDEQFGGRYPLMITRVQEEYLKALPGIESSSISKVLKEKFIKSRNK